MTMTDDAPAHLYPEHLATLAARAEQALERGGYEHLLIAAGRPVPKFLDDQDYPYAVQPAFKQWLPLLDAPGSWLSISPGQRPKLVFLQPEDYWHAPPATPAGYWLAHVDLIIIRRADEATAHLPGAGTRRAILGAPADALAGLVPNNPPLVTAGLDYHRAYKTAYEQCLIRAANRLAVRGHQAAEQAFRAGASELEIHQAYLAALGQLEAELPYASIVAVNEHAAILHYMRFERSSANSHRSLLIDAGAGAAGYAADISRSYAAVGAGEFQALIDAVEQAQQGFAAQVVAGQSYPELHLQAHHALAEVLAAQGIIRMSAEAAVAQGVSAAFFPHGLGHLLGLQVHDVGGFLRDDGGQCSPKLAGHPHLRLTRKLEPGMVVTIEPGLYFIDMLLNKLRAGPLAGQIDWRKIEALQPYGGLRIEDNVLCTDGAPENFTRAAFAAMQTADRKYCQEPVLTAAQ